MKSEEIKPFADEVYRQCVDKGMTCEQFGLFAALINLRKKSAFSTVRHQMDQLPLPSLD